MSWPGSAVGNRPRPRRLKAPRRTPPRRRSSSGQRTRRAAGLPPEQPLRGGRPSPPHAGGTVFLPRWHLSDHVPGAPSAARPTSRWLPQPCAGAFDGHHSLSSAAAWPLRWSRIVLRSPVAQGDRGGFEATQEQSTEEAHHVPENTRAGRVAARRGGPRRPDARPQPGVPPWGRLPRRRLPRRRLPRRRRPLRGLPRRLPLRGLRRLPQSPLLRRLSRRLARLPPLLPGLLRLLPLLLQLLPLLRLVPVLLLGRVAGVGVRPGVLWLFRPAGAVRP